MTDGRVSNSQRHHLGCTTHPRGEVVQPVRGCFSAVPLSFCARGEDSAVNPEAEVGQVGGEGEF